MGKSLSTTTTKAAEATKADTPMDSRRTLATTHRELGARYAPFAVEGKPYAYRDLPGALIRRLQQSVAAALSRQFEAYGGDLTPMQYSVLAGVYTHPAIEQGALADLIGYDRATVGGVVDRLEDKGLVQRSLSTHDRRVRLLGLSAAGRAMVRKLQFAVLAAQDDVLAPLDDAERDTLQALLRKLVK